MKNVYQAFAKCYPKILIGIAALVSVIMVMSFVAYDKSATLAEDEAIKHDKPENITSISMVNGTCKINYDIIKTNKNKQILIDYLYSTILTEKKSKTEIPAFILSFMESISENKKFEMANPGEPWCVNDIMGFTLTKMYDSQKKDTFNLISPGRNDIPNKQLIYFGISKNMALLSYYTGGIRMSQHVAILRFKNNKVIDFWCNTYIGMTASTKADIIEGLTNGGGC